MNSSSKALAILILAAAPAGAAVVEDTVAVVNGTPIMLTEYNKELASAVDYWNKINPGALTNLSRLKELREKTLEQLIDHEVLYQEGNKLKLKVRERDIEDGMKEIKRRFSRDEMGNPLDDATIEESFQKQLKQEGLSSSQFRERLTKQIMARKVLDQEVKSKLHAPEDKDVKDFFDKIKAYTEKQSSDTLKGMDEDFAQAFKEVAQQVKVLSSERVRVSRILVKFSPGASPQEKKRAKATVDAVKKKIDEGGNFAEIAKTESEDPESAPQGGDIGFIVRGMTPPEFEKIAFSLPVGDVSAPIETEYGYHIIRVQEKRAAEAPDYERFKDNLAQFLMNVNAAKEVERFVKGLKSKAVIERNLPAVK
jgi:peptidyl-prolyl cis-trans isomerase C